MHWHQELQKPKKKGKPLPNLEIMLIKTPKHDISSSRNLPFLPLSPLPTHTPIRNITIEKSQAIANTFRNAKKYK